MRTHTHTCVNRKKFELSRKLNATELITIRLLNNPQFANNLVVTFNKWHNLKYNQKISFQH